MHTKEKVLAVLKDQVTECLGYRILHFFPKVEQPKSWILKIEQVELSKKLCSQLLLKLVSPWKGVLKYAVSLKRVSLWNFSVNKFLEKGTGVFFLKQNNKQTKHQKHYKCPGSKY